MEFCKGGREDSSKQKMGAGNQDLKKKSQQFRQMGRVGDSRKSAQQQSLRQRTPFYPPQQPYSSSFPSGSGQGQTSRQPYPPRPSGVVTFPPNTRRHDGPDRRGKGKGGQRKTKVAVLATSEELRGLANQMDQEAAQ